MIVADIESFPAIRTEYLSESIAKEEIEDVVISDLMSDVLTMDTENMLLITGLCTDQAIRTADIIGAVAVIISYNKKVTASMIAIAKECDIAIFSTAELHFKVCSLVGEMFRG